MFTVIGAAGGFAVGLFAGLSAFDDAVNSEKKVTTTAVLSAAGGGVGGFFLGRALDKNATKRTQTNSPDVFGRSLAAANRPQRFHPAAPITVRFQPPLNWAKNTPTPAVD